MTRYSAWAVFKNGLSGQKDWDRQWRDPEPKKEYDIVIVGAGLHGLATAYYLAKNHDLKNIAIVVLRPALPPPSQPFSTIAMFFRPWFFAR